MPIREKCSRARACRCWGVWAGAGLALASSASWSGVAHAQRGEGYALNTELDVDPGPNDGFPGAFDTQMVRKGAFVASLPTLNAYYGATEDLSVGANVLTFLPLLGGVPAGSLFARYRLGSTAWFRSTADVMLGGIKGEGSGTYLGVALLGTNTEFALTRRQRLTLSGWYWRIHGGFEDNSIDFNMLLLGGTYSINVAHWAAFHFTGLFLTAGDLTTEGLDGTDAADFSGIGSATDRIVLRGTASLRAGSWLFDLGAIRLGPAVLPWLGIAFEVGG